MGADEKGWNDFCFTSLICSTFTLKTNGYQDQDHNLDASDSRPASLTTDSTQNQNLQRRPQQDSKLLIQIQSIPRASGRPHLTLLGWYTGAFGGRDGSR